MNDSPTLPADEAVKALRRAEPHIEVCEKLIEHALGSLIKNTGFEPTAIHFTLYDVTTVSSSRKEHIVGNVKVEINTDPRQGKI
jgi:hypothetical protein